MLADTMRYGDQFSPDGINLWNDYAAYVILELPPGVFSDCMSAYTRIRSPMATPRRIVAADSI